MEQKKWKEDYELENMLSCYECIIYFLANIIGPYSPNECQYNDTVVK